jgi:hypothetical protein
VRGAIYSIHRNPIVWSLQRIVDKTTSSARQILTSVSFWLSTSSSALMFHLCVCVGVCVYECALDLFLPWQMNLLFVFFILFRSPVFFHFNPGLCFCFCIDAHPPSCEMISASLIWFHIQYAQKFVSVDFTMHYFWTLRQEFPMIRLCLILCWQCY